jgi:predicted permease
MPASSGSNEFEGSVPGDLLAHLDFISSLTIIGLSFVFRQLGLLKDEHVPGLRLATFNFALPALNLSLLWKANITLEIAIVLFVGLVSSLITAGIAMGFAYMARPDNRGFYAMALCGNAVSFVYPALLGSDRLGAGTITAAVMMELGGNLWMANIYYAVVGRAFAPSSKKMDGMVSDSPSVDSLESAPHAPPVTQFGSANAPQSPDDSGCPFSDHIAQSEPASSGPPSAKQQGVSKEPRVVALLTRNVLLWAIAIGFILNVTGAPYYAIPGKSLQMLGVMFGPLLYAIVGAELQFNLGASSYGVVLRVLLSRWLCNAVAVGIVRLLPWGLSPPIRGALTLCMIAPLPSTFVMYTGLYGYRRDQAAVMYSVSAVASLAALSLLAPLV